MSKLLNLRNLVSDHVCDNETSNMRVSSGLRDKRIGYIGDQRAVKLAVVAGGVPVSKQAGNPIICPAPAHGIRARVWVGNSKDDAPSVAWTNLNIKTPRRTRRFSHFIYKGLVRIPIWR